MSQHFSLDIDPEGLRSVARRMAELKSHLAGKGRTVGATPADIGDAWTGRAATRVKQEMAGLGVHMGRFAEDLQPAIEGIEGRLGQ